DHEVVHLDKELSEAIGIELSLRSFERRIIVLILPAAVVTTVPAIAGLGDVGTIRSGVPQLHVAERARVVRHTLVEAEVPVELVDVVVVTSTGIEVDAGIDLLELNAETEFL